MNYKSDANVDKRIDLTLAIHSVPRGSFLSASLPDVSFKTQTRRAEVFLTVGACQRCCRWHRVVYSSRHGFVSPTIHQ